MNERQLLIQVFAILAHGQPGPEPDRPPDVEVPSNPWGDPTMRLWFVAEDTVAATWEGIEYLPGEDCRGLHRKTARFFKPGIAAKIRALISAPDPFPKLVRCDCGHECEAGLVMSASLGSSCPECYDKMSD